MARHCGLGEHSHFDILEVLESKALHSTSLESHVRKLSLGVDFFLTIGILVALKFFTGSILVLLLLPSYICGHPLPIRCSGRNPFLGILQVSKLDAHVSILSNLFSHL